MAQQFRCQWLLQECLAPSLLLLSQLPGTTWYWLPVSWHPCVGLDGVPHAWLYLDPMQAIPGFDGANWQMEQQLSVSQ